MFKKVRKLDKKIIFFSLSLAFLFSCSLAMPAFADGASLYLLPSSGSYRIGEVFSISLFLKTEKIAINAAQATIKFPPQRLEVVNISKSAPIFTLWIQEPIWSNARGEISFGGGLPSPGYRGEAGRILTIVFRGKSEGEARLFFEKGIITANDPWGTNIFSFGQEGIFSILSPIEPLPAEPRPIESRPTVVDTEPPLPFEIILDDEGDPTNPQPLLYFKTTDELSGMSHYEIKIGEEDFFRVAIGETMPYRFSFLSPRSHQVTIRAFDKAGDYIDSEAEVKVESIEAPQITVCPKTYNAGEEILYIAGRALSDHTVVIFLKAKDKIVKSWEVYSDEKGEWFLIEDGLFRPGTYTVSARAKDVRGAISDFSEEQIIEVFLGGFVVGPWIIDYKNLTLFVFVIFAIISLAALSLFLKIRKIKKTIEKEAKDLREKFSQEYKELCQDIEKELVVLKRLRGKRKITDEERKRETELLKNLADIKEIFEKELKDIEEIK